MSDAFGTIKSDEGLITLFDKNSKSGKDADFRIDEHERVRDWILEALGANSEAFFKSAKLANYDDSDS